MELKLRQHRVQRAFPHAPAISDLGEGQYSVSGTRLFTFMVAYNLPVHSSLTSDTQTTIRRKSSCFFGAVASV